MPASATATRKDKAPRKQKTKKEKQVDSDSDEDYASDVREVNDRIYPGKKCWAGSGLSLLGKFPQNGEISRFLGSNLGNCIFGGNVCGIFSNILVNLNGRGVSIFLCSFVHFGLMYCVV